MKEVVPVEIVAGYEELFRIPISGDFDPNPPDYGSDLGHSIPAITIQQTLLIQNLYVNQ